jgi:hypothetical protein
MNGRKSKSRDISAQCGQQSEISETYDLGGTEVKQIAKGDGMRKLVTVLLAAALIWSIQQNTPVKKSFADRAKAKPVQVATPEKVAEVTASAPTEPEPAHEPATPQVVTPVAQPPVPSTHDALMAAAGITPADYGAVDYIVSHESSWNVDATNASTGAHGLIQALPYTKTGCGWSDGVCQLRWASTYAVDRYGSWWGAQAFWQSHHWW